MKSGKWNRGLFVSFIIVPCIAAMSHAATVTVSSSGSGQYVVQGAGFNGVAATEFILVYDPTALKNPRVAQGGLMSGAQMVANTNVAGAVRIAAVSPYPTTTSGTGTIATISFDRTGTGSPSLALSGSPTFLNVQGAPLSEDSTDTSLAANNTGGGSAPDVNSTPTGGPTTITAPGTATGGGVSAPTGWLGGVSMPSDGTTVEAKVNAPATVVPEPEKTQTKEGETAAKDKVVAAGEASPPATSADSKGARDTNVLEQFRLFQGERTPKNLIDLLARSVAGSGQKPLVALSDGKANVELSVECPSAGKSAPNFALKGAKLVSLKKAGAATWIVEILPDKGAFEVTVNILQDNAIRQIPLAVVPPLPADLKIGNGGTLTEADFNQFLKDRGTAKAPRFDLNGDGKRDYIDDYIFAANYVVKLDAAKQVAKKK